MGPVDAWFVRNFPPYSWRRLFFLLAFAPVTSALVVALGGSPSGGGFSWGSVFLLTMCVWTALPLIWVHIRATADAEEVRPRPSAPKLPPVLARPIRQKPDNDFLISFLISFCGFTTATALVDEGGVSFMSFAIGTGCALAFTLVLRFRYSIWTIVAIAAVGAFPAAMMIELFFMFLSDGGSFWVTYAVSALLIFVFLLEPWLRIRRARFHPVLGTIPMWMISAAASTMLVIGALSAAPMDRIEPKDRRLGSGASSAPSPVGAANDQDAALRLFHAWRFGDREHALTVANDVVVEPLFHRPFDPVAQPLGCNATVASLPACIIRTSTDVLVLRTLVNDQGRTFVYALEPTSFETPITFPERGDEHPDA